MQQFNLMSTREYGWRQWRPKMKAYDEAVSKAWVDGLGLEDGVIRRALIVIGASGELDVQAAIVNGLLLNQRGMGPARMSVVRKRFKMNPEPVPEAFKDHMASVLKVMARFIDNDIARSDVENMSKAMIKFDTVSDCKIYSKQIRRSGLQKHIERLIQEARDGGIGKK